jgi:hypothetical protein
MKGDDPACNPLNGHTFTELTLADGNLEIIIFTYIIIKGFALSRESCIHHPEEDLLKTLTVDRELVLVNSGIPRIGLERLTHKDRDPRWYRYARFPLSFSPFLL